MKTVYRASDPIDAQLVVDLLAAGQVAAHVQGLFLAGGVGELPAVDTLRVWVADSDEERAREVLDASRRELTLENSLDPVLERSWRRAWLGIRGAGEGLALRDELLAAWSEPWRRYHGLQHLLECLSLFDEHAAVARHPAEVELALWFHDAVYSLKAQDNEARSADWARKSLAASGVDAAAAGRVHALVMATRHSARAGTMDAQLLVDLDLAILGAEPERFDEYDVQVREEYAWVPGIVFRRKRAAVLRQFLAREQLYEVPEIRAQLESRARSNLTRALTRLRPWYLRLLRPGQGVV